MIYIISYFIAMNGIKIILYIVGFIEDSNSVERLTAKATACGIMGYGAVFSSIMYELNEVSLALLMDRYPFLLEVLVRLNMFSWQLDMVT